MQIFEEEVVGSGLRPILLKLSSHATMVTEDDTLLDSTSENSSEVSPQIQDSSVISESWTDLNEIDVDDHLSSPPLSEIIQRAVVVLEKHITNVMRWRANKIHALAAVTGSAHGVTCPGTNNGARTASDTDGRTDTITLDTVQRKELIQYISTIASMYNNVLYHNFEHASHVLASSDSLITMMLQTNDKRASVIPGPNRVSIDETSVTEVSEEKRIHMTTFGISACPMTHLALIFSALVHDVEHQGVGNAQLIKEKNVLATKYEGKSVAENNSLDVSVELLHQDCYLNLRKCMFGDKEIEEPRYRAEFEQDEFLFQHVMLNVIQATDISSKDRLESNTQKWKKAFEDPSQSHSDRCFKLQISKQARRSSMPPASSQAVSGRSRRMSLDIDQPVQGDNLGFQEDRLVHMNYLRASSVLEQLIQAADVAHSMQSWPIFLKWNTKLYDELWAANLAGRGGDVSAVWSKGQISFFDNYIMPLATRLGQCGVFGELGTLFLENAKENRARWLEEGDERCKEMHQRVLKMQGDMKHSKS